VQSVSKIFTLCEEGNGEGVMERSKDRKGMQWGRKEREKGEWKLGTIWGGEWKGLEMKMEWKGGEGKAYGRANGI